MLRKLVMYFCIFTDVFDYVDRMAKMFTYAYREIELLHQDIEQEKQKIKALMQLLLTGVVGVKT